MIAVSSSVLPLWTPPVARTSAPARAPRQLTVEKIDQAALLTDVQDDLASLLSAFVRRQSGRRHGDDTADSPAPEYEALPTSPNIESVAQIRELLAGQQPRWRLAMDLLRGLFPDPAEQALVLAGLRSDPKLSEEIREEINTALAELTAQRGEALANSANLGRVVQQFANKTGLSAESLRAAYRTLIKASAGERELYIYLINTFGFAQRGLALDFLEQAVAADLSAAGPAYAAELFKPLLGLLLQLRLIRCADNILLSTLRRKTRRQLRRGRSGGRPGAKNDGQFNPKKFSNGLVEEALIALLLAALSDVVSAQQQFAQFLQKLGAYTERTVLQPLARAILRAMAGLPCELFPDLASRQALLAGLHTTYDQLFTPVQAPAYRTYCYV